jgi:DNA gyrase subunit A
MAAIDDILSFIHSGASADDLLESAFSADSPDVYAAALEEHGSWDSALAATLVYVVRRESGTMSRGRSSVNVDDVERPERRVGPDARLPLYLVSRSGQVFRTTLDSLSASRSAELVPFPDGPGAEHLPERLFLGGSDPSLVVITVSGNALRIDARLFPEWERDATTRPLSHRFGELEDDDVAAALMLTRALRDAERFYSVSVFGQIKATDSTEYRRVDASPTQALLLRDEDALFDVFTAAARTDVFVASSAAKAIVFPTDDVRSQGRKATGVRAIALDPDARVVGAFPARDEEWVVLATERGLLKRMSLEEFRPQSRAGGGLQTCRLAGGDHVASVAPIAIDGDLVALTSRGRVARFPAYDVPFGSRAAKGEAVLELESDETVVQVLGVPAGAMD